jgi:hypothetical protein
MRRTAPVPVRSSRRSVEFCQQRPRERWEEFAILEFHPPIKGSIMQLSHSTTPAARAAGLRRRQIGLLSAAVAAGVALSAFGAPAAFADDATGVTVNSTTSATLSLGSGATANLTLSGTAERYFMTDAAQDQFSYLGTASQYDLDGPFSAAFGAKVQTITDCPGDTTTCAPGRLVIELSEPMTDVKVHLSDLGSRGPIITGQPTAFFSDAYRLVSSQPARATVTPSAGASFTTDASGAVWGLNSPCNETPGAGCGSLVVSSPTPITRLEFDVALRTVSPIASDSNDNTIISVSGTTVPKPTPTPTPTVPQPTTPATPVVTPTDPATPTAGPTPIAPVPSASVTPTTTPAAVVPGKPTGAKPAGSGLANTGAEASVLPIVAGSALAAGLAFVGVAAFRRRRADRA